MNESAQAKKQSRKSFYKKRAAECLNRIGAVKDIRSLHICTPVHRAKALGLRIDLQTVNKLDVIKKQTLFNNATEAYTDSKIKYAEFRLELGDAHKETQKAHAMMEHLKRLKAQRLRRLREAKGRVPSC